MIRIAEFELRNTPVHEVVFACANRISRAAAWYHDPGTILLPVVTAIEIACAVWWHQSKPVRSVFVKTTRTP